MIDIIGITDDDGEEWTKVDYLGQDTVFEESPNTSEYSLRYITFSNETPALLKLKKVPKDMSQELQMKVKYKFNLEQVFLQNADEELLPNPDNVGSCIITQMEI